MADVVVRVRVNQLTGFRIRVDRCKAEVPDVIRPAGFVQQYVPVRPADSTAVEVIDHRASIRFAQSPGGDVLSLEGIDGSFSEEKVLVRESLVHELDVVEHLIATAPWLVPVIPDAPYILGGFGVLQDGADSLIDEIAVVVPGDDLLVTQSFSLHRRAEIVFQEVSLVFR